MTHPCTWCDKSVHTLGESELAGAKYWHGDCYRDYLHEITNPLVTVIGSYSHDERVADGLEQP